MHMPRDSDKISLAQKLLLEGKQWYRGGDYPKALDCLKEALQITREIGDRAGEGTMLNNIGRVYDSLGQYQEVLGYYNKALPIVKEIGDRAGEGATLNGIGGVYRSLGQFQEALRYYNQALPIFKEICHRAGEGATLNNIGGVYQSLGDYNKAMEYFKQSLVITMELGDRLGEAITINNLALLYYAQGRYEEAKPLYERSLSIYEKVLGPEHPDVATSINNLALLYDAQGRFEQAEPLYKRALAIREKALGPENPYVATSLNNLAELYRAQGRYTEAEPLLDRAIAIREKALGKEHPDVATTLNNLAKLYRAQGKYAEAELLHKRPLSIKDRAPLKKLLSKEVNVEKEIEQIWKEHLIKQMALLADEMIKLQPKKILAKTTKPPDLVHFTVVSLPEVSPGNIFELDIWAHLERQRDTVLKRAREAFGKGAVYIKSKGPVQVQRGTLLSIRLKIEGLIVKDPKDIILWDGEIANATFVVQVPDDAKKGHRTCTATVHVNGLRVARICFTILVTEKMSCAVDHIPSQEERHRKAFASYASADREAVLARIQGMQKVSPELEVFLDVVSLRSGQYWEKKLWEVIPLHDIFYLFWSENAQQSRWVEKEWQCALKTRGLDFIDPVPLVSPLKMPPPPELASKHFNDWVLAFMERPS